MTGPGLAKCPRIGHSMLLALAYVKAHPGCSKYACAKAIGLDKSIDPAHSPGALYETIDRCIDIGLLDAQQPSGRVYSLHLTDLGTVELNKRTT